MAAPANNRTGTSTHSPQLMTDVDGVYQYGLVIREDWGVTVFRHTKADGTITTYDLSANTTAQNGLGLYLQNGVYGILSSDDHFALALGVDDQDRVWIGGNSHSNRLRLIRSGIGDITTWTQQGLSTFDSLGARSHTYYTFARLSTGQLLMFFNQDDSLATSQGRDYLAFKLQIGGNTWSAIVGDGHFATTENGPAGEADRVYVTGVRVDHNDRVHVAGIWRTNDADADSQQRPWYVYSDDLSTWKAVDGTTLTMPLTWFNFAPAEITSAPGFSRNYGAGIGLDADGYPSVIHQDGSSSLYVRLYWDGTDWQSTYLTTDGTAGGPPFSGSANGPSVHDIRNRLYLVTQGSSRVRVRELSTGAVLYMGPADSGFEPNPDPIALLDGSLELCVPDGDTPRVITFGNHHRAIAS